MNLNPGPVLALLGLFACEGDATDPDDVGLPIGDVAVFLAPGADLGDMPPSVSAVWLRVEDVLVRHVDHGWVPVVHAHQDIDLMALRGGSRVPVGLGPVYEGAYEALQLYVTSAWVVEDGEVVDLVLSSGRDGPDEGVVVRGEFFVDQDTRTSLVASWDLGLHRTQGTGTWSLASAPAVAVEGDGR